MSVLKRILRFILIFIIATGLLGVSIYNNAYAWGYYNNVVLNGTTDSSLQWIYLDGYKRQLARTIAHEMIHCYQYHTLGFWQSRPIKNIPLWKWEGYPEYISYLSDSTNEKEILLNNIYLLQQYEADSSNNHAEVSIDEGLSFAGTSYMRNWLVVKYLIDQKQMTFKTILSDTTSQSVYYAEMIDWAK